MTKLLSDIPEDIADEKWFACAAGFLTAVLPGKKYDRIKQYLKTYRSSIDDVTHSYMKELGRAKIDICTPLMMDLTRASSALETDDLPYTNKDGFPNQIDLISQQAAAYPWQIFPFVMFDPRREKSDEICITALEEKGFIGVKMYPPLGYHPSWRVMKEPGPMWDDVIEADPDAAIRLKKLYTYCGEKKIPITTHASIGGAYSVYKEEEGRITGAWPLTEISNWLDAIHEYNLKINFAHFGGNYLHKILHKRQQSLNWRRQILSFIARSKSNRHFGKLYTDLSFHDMAHSRKTKAQYFSDLRQLLENPEYSSRILYGSDASMTSHTWTEAAFMKPFKANLDTNAQNKIFKDNAVDFLFENAQIPESYVNFLRRELGDRPFDKLKDWVREENGDYFIVT
jgi:predicted TIM-barrel fold metal-dependent hydrolase